jgi:hypothetical protein
VRLRLLAPRSEQYCPGDDCGERRDAKGADPPGGQWLVEEHHARGDRQRVRQQGRQTGRRQRATTLEGGLEDGDSGAVEDDQAEEEGHVLESAGDGHLGCHVARRKEDPGGDAQCRCAPDRPCGQSYAEDRPERRGSEPDRDPGVRRSAPLSVAGEN